MEYVKIFIIGGGSFYLLLLLLGFISGLIKGFKEHRIARREIEISRKGSDKSWMN